MKEGKERTTIELKAEIVEIFDKEGKRFAKLIYKPGIIDIATDKIRELHLGDKVIIRSELKLNNIIEIHEENNKLNLT